MKVVITNYTGDRQNWGCQSTSLGLIRYLKRHLGEVEIATIPLKSKFPDIKRVPRGDLRAELVDMMRGGKAAMRTLLATYNEGEIAALSDADLVLFQGEGTMVGNKFYNSENLFSAPIAANRMFGKPVWSINQTVFSLDTEFTKFASEAFNTVFERNFVREPASLRFMRDAGVRDAALLPDLAFYDDLDTNEVSPAAYPAFSGLARIESLDPKLLLRMVGEIVSRHGGLSIVASTDLDLDFADLATKSFGDRIQLVGKDRTRQEAFEAIKAAPFFFSGRYHMNIYAAKAGTPFVQFLSNTHKNLGLSWMLNYPLMPREVVPNYDVAADIEYLNSNAENLSRELKSASGLIYGFLDRTNIFDENRGDHNFGGRLPSTYSTLSSPSYLDALNGVKQRSGFMRAVRSLIGIRH
ncbi:hypothetical protein J2T09_005561 [Neorhizobium huautlense]|uniref:Polysaccharide pyruvyl transferase domain-containing protein n=1 Tax=Neorhizobium huautlense TaxID=67774 RepID=A0ABT9Q215_9HYPH|nr:polysaccharide pyruvyl transferase family protein [Neorhizobium huautlense]MDP9840773.1 hypothetical protein [Neorhizobium huautlense]